MSEREFLREVSERLIDLYGAERVEREPLLPSTSRRPDFVVYEEEDRETLALVVEAVAREDKSEYRQQRDIELLQRVMEATGAEYGAIVGPDFDYVFRYVDEMAEPTTLDDLPGATESPGTRPLSSASEVRFLLNRLTDRFDFGSRANEGSVAEVFQSLLYKLVAERNDERIDLDADIGSQIEEMERSVGDEFPELRHVELSSPNQRLARTVLSLFHGFDLDDSPPEVAVGFVDWFSTWSQSVKPQTSPDLAKKLAELADFDRPTQLTTLDPASGIGALSRAAAKRSAAVTSVEGSDALVVSALLLNELTGHRDDIELVLADFLIWSEDRNASQQSQLTQDFFTSGSSSPRLYDRILLSPPAGGKVDADRVPIIGEGRKNVRVEEAFVARSLELLSEGGLLVALVPEYILSGRRSQPLREYILHEFTIRSIVTFDETVLVGSASRGAVVVIERDRSPYEQRISTLSVTSQDESQPNTLEEAIDSINAGEGKEVRFNREEVRTLLPSQIQGEVEVREKIVDRYGASIKLSEIANVLSGNRIERNVDEQSDVPDKGPHLPYLDNPKSTDLDSLTRYPRSEASVVAEPNDILLSVKGKQNEVFPPSESVIPSSRWAVIRLDSPCLAEDYREFLSSDLGKQILEANRSGSAIPFISIADLRELPVPDLRDENGGD